MNKKISRREQAMIAAVIGIATLFAGSLLVSSFRRSYGETAEDLSTRRQELRSLREVLKDQAQWNEREIWLGANQPTLQNAEHAGVDLLEEVRKSARAHGVLLERPELGGSRAHPSYQSVFLSVQTKSGWSGLVAFMNDLQQPEKFIVFEEATIRTGDNDPSQIQGQFRIGRWYAP